MKRVWDQWSLGFGKQHYGSVCQSIMPIEKMITLLTPKIDAVPLTPNIASTPVAAAMRKPIIISTTERVRRKGSVTHPAKVLYLPIMRS
jgi:hypothetical protein